MEITKRFIECVAHSSEALRDKAFKAEQEPEAKADTEVGRIVRNMIEQYRQEADLLDGWLPRAKKELGMEN